MRKNQINITYIGFAKKNWINLFSSHLLVSPKKIGSICFRLTNRFRQKKLDQFVFVSPIGFAKKIEK